MRRGLLSFLAILLFLVSNAQTQLPADIQSRLANHPELYFRFENPGPVLLRELGSVISIDNVKEGMVYAYATESDYLAFLSYNIEVEQLTPPSLLLPSESLNMQDNINQKSTLAWDYYPTYTAYVSLMQQFATNYPAICKLDTIGTTVDGRLLLVVRISDNVNTEENEPEFFYSSTMHGDETTGYVLMLHLIDYLLTNYGTVSRVTNLVNNMEIYINPNANPDGTYAGGNSTVSGATRSNANGEDLNRNYPVPDGSTGDDGTYAQEVETQAFIAFAEERAFVVAANFHGGAELVNYPWDYTTTNHADKTWWIYVSNEYADTAQAFGSAGYLDDNNPGSDYPGVIEGATWYYAPGSRQDYAQYFAQSREVTIEISSTKLPSASTLESYWNYNYRSLLNYMEQALYGIRGIVTDNCTGNPVKALITINSHDLDSSQVYSSLPVGNYHRPIAPGTWSMTVSAPGYQSQTLTNIVTTNKNTTIRNVSLIPTAPSVAFNADVTNTCTGVVTFNNASAYSTGSTFLWNFGDGNTSTMANPTHTYTSNGTYTVKLKIMSCAGNDSLTKPSYITVAMPVAPAAIGDTICANMTAGLSASGSGTLTWYDVPTGGSSIGTGSSFTTPTLTGTTNYYVSSESSSYGSAQHIGMTNNSSGGSYFTNTGYRYMIFDVSEPLRLESVKVYVNTAGNRNILLQNSAGTTINSATVNIPTGSNPYTVTLNFDIPVGNGYRLGVETGTANNLYVANSPSYPYEIPGVMSITGNSQNPIYYYFFYDWVVKTLDVCSSPRTLVTAVVDPLPVSSFTHVDNYLDVDFTATATNASSYNWDFGDSQTSVIQNPSHTYAASGVYTVVLDVTNDCGTDSYQEDIDLVSISMDDLSLGDINVYPNPLAREILNCEFNLKSAETVEIQVLTLMGAEVLTQSAHFDAGQNRMEVLAGNLANGYYMLRLNTGEGIYLIPLVIE